MLDLPRRTGSPLPGSVIDGRAERGTRSERADWLLARSGLRAETGRGGDEKIPRDEEGTGVGYLFSCSSKGTRDLRRFEHGGDEKGSNAGSKGPGAGRFTPATVLFTSRTRAGEESILDFATLISPR